MMTNTEQVLNALHNAPSILMKEYTKSMTLHGDDLTIANAASEFPDVFMLPQGVVACVSRSSSFVSEGRVMLYTAVLNRDLVWRVYAKGTVSELRSHFRRMTKADLIDLIDRAQPKGD